MTESARAQDGPPRSESGLPLAISIVSGYFNPIHVGHVRLIEAARDIADYVIVIVNNDRQQLAKKGRIIMTEADRLRVVSALRDVSEAFVATDSDESVADSLASVRLRYPETAITFCNGGDRSAKERLPGRESLACLQHGITMQYGVGGEDKPDSSSRINEALGL